MPRTRNFVLTSVVTCASLSAQAQDATERGLEWMTGRVVDGGTEGRLDAVRTAFSVSAFEEAGEWMWHGRSRPRPARSSD